jgi:hypothetical protein
MPAGSSVSGQYLVQPLASVQVIFPPFSEVSRYRVRPDPLTRTLPTPGTDAVEIVTPDDGLPAAAGAAVPEDPVVGAAVDADLLLELPHAASTSAAPTAVTAGRRPNRVVKRLRLLMRASIISRTS